MKKMILLMASVFCSLGFAGNGGVSGGDPKAVEFLVIAKKVCPWAIGSVENQYPQIANCTQLIADLDSSLNGPEKAKLSFTDDPVFDQGVSKVAVFDLNQETITVNRTLWDSSTLQEKYVTVGVELSGLSGVDQRYDIGQAIENDFFAISGANQICSRTPLVVIAIEVATATLCEQLSTDDLSSIQELNLQQRNIFRLDSGDFKDLPNLKIINLSDNQLTELPTDLFQGVSSLQHLYLQNNLFTQVEKDLITASNPSVQIDF
jgi:Leucine-rich repeat (LRR) protein